MRKYIIICIALCLQVAARGQTIVSLDDIDLSGLPQPTQAKALRYWFDSNGGSMRTDSILNGRHTVDASSLLDGLHTIHYQIIDNEDKVAAPCSGIFLKMESRLSELGEGNTLRYWFDDDTNVCICNANIGIQSLDASDLLDGLHTLHLQVVNAEGKVSYVASGIFLKTGSTNDAEGIKASKLMYWFDDDTTIKHIDVTDELLLLDASELTEGLHTLHYQALCNNGQMTPATSSIFLRLSIDVEASVAKSLRYWFDDEQDATEIEVTEGVQLLDASGLTEGLHTVHYQATDTGGMLGTPVSSVFLKMDTDTATAKSIRYWFDDDATTVQVTDAANGTQTLDVSALQTGLHTLNYQLIDTGGKVGVPVTRIFLKNFDKVITSGHNCITKYQYWLNDNSATVQTVTLGETSNPYTLIALLPMQQEPFRSSSFHFEMTDGKPMMYAKNDFHIRFTDAQGYFVDDSRPFTDYSVSREVKPVGELQASQTFGKVAENDVRWYTVQVAPGDTVAFKLSQPATVQLFAPSGKEVFKTSESASVNWGGIHTWEDGTYYLAVHDVTGSKEDMTLEYMHMDKYDVVDWDVHRVGNGGCSTITFKGNGFRDLYAVDLVIAPGDTIHSVDVSHDSDAETAVTFDFTDATLGDYNAVFHFTEEDKHVVNVVTVEEAVDIELATDVSFPSSFLRGTPTTYTIKITNKGNMTAYNVPMRTYIGTKTKNGVSSVNFEGLDLKSPIDMILMDSVPVSDRAEVESIIKSLDDSHYFLNIHTTDANNDSIIVRSAYSFVTLQPYSTKTIKLSIATNETVDVWFTTEPDWFALGLSNMDDTKSNGRLKARRKSGKDSYCCVKDAIECGISLAVSAADIASVLTSAFALAQGGANLGADAVAAAADCVAGMASNMYSWINTMVCEGETPIENIKNNFNSKISVLNMVLSCLGTLKVTAKVGQALLMGVGVDVVANDVGLNADCITKSTQKKPNCPPCKGSGCGGGGTSTPQPPSDPNDIYGYLSEAGSKFIADSVARVNYTIEFENDTAFATAAAHTIVIKDTLDSRYFDLTKFMPTGVRIGGHEAFLDEADVVSSNSKTSFVKTIDMRPEINAIAQVEGEFNQKNGIAQWTFQSLDPMTMEPTDDLMQGILPVNYNGTSGIGEVMFEVGVKQGKADGTELSNRAGIVFDYEEAILTPTWTNIVDAVAPRSIVDGLTLLSDSTLRVFADGEDARSGVWKYEWYVRHGENAPWWKEGETFDNSFDFHFYEGFDYGFCVIATDSAGNVERKELQAERLFKTYGEEFEEAVSLGPIPASPVGDSRIYDLSGRRHDEPQEGINIVGRKKVLFRRRQQ